MPEGVPLASAYLPDQAQQQQLPPHMVGIDQGAGPGAYPVIPERGGGSLSVPPREGGDFQGPGGAGGQMQQPQQGFAPAPGGGGRMPPPGMGGGGGQGDVQSALPFPQLSGKELAGPINMGPDGIAMSVDQMTMQQQYQQRQQQAMMQQAYARRQQEEVYRRAVAQQELEKRISTIAKDELKQQALGFVAIGVCAVLGLALFSPRSALS